MDREELLALYDRDVRRGSVIPGMRREEVPPVVRQLMEAEAEARSFISYSELDAANADAIIAREIAYFAPLGHPLEWAVCAHDQPPDLSQRLVAAGFVCEEDEEAIMVLDLARAPESLWTPPGADVRRLSDPDRLEEVRQLLEAVWDEPFDWFIPRMRRLLASSYTAIFVAYVQDEPASVAWLLCPEGGQFAGLYGGSTLPAFRGQGLYTSLLAVRAQEARRRGYRYLTIDAGDMSRPIVEKRGFELLTTATPYLLKPGT